MRDKRIDLCKGFGIILMVLGHAGMPYSNVIFRFHMALFFIISGYLFSNSKVDNIQKLGKYVVNKLKTLYLPFVIWNIFLVVTRNVFLNIGIYTDNPLFLEKSEIIGATGNAYGITNVLTTSKAIDIIKKILLFSSEQQLGGGTWFLRVLFGVSLIWAISNYLIIKTSRNSFFVQWIINSIVTIIMLLLSNQFQETRPNLPMQFRSVASAYIMFYFGYYFKQLILQNKGLKLKKGKIYKASIMAFAVIILILCDKVCTLLGWNSNVNNYNYWPMYVVSSLSGFACIYILSDFIISFKNLFSRLLTTGISFAGEKSLYVLLGHLLAFKIIIWLQLKIFDQPLYRLASYPCFYNKGIWWLAYTVAGIVLPLLLINLYYKIIKKPICLAIKRYRKR